MLASHGTIFKDSDGVPGTAVAKYYSEEDGLWKDKKKPNKQFVC